MCVYHQVKILYYHYPSLSFPSNILIPKIWTVRWLRVQANIFKVDWSAMDNALSKHTDVESSVVACWCVSCDNPLESPLSHCQSQSEPFWVHHSSRWVTVFYLYRRFFFMYNFSLHKWIFYLEVWNLDECCCVVVQIETEYKNNSTAKGGGFKSMSLPLTDPQGQAVQETDGQGSEIRPHALVSCGWPRSSVAGGWWCAWTECEWPPMWIWLLHSVAGAVGMLHSVGIIYVDSWHEHSCTPLCWCSLHQLPRSAQVCRRTQKISGEC